MKIKITSDATGKPWELAGDGKAGSDSMSPSFKRNIEDLAFLRAASVEPVSRGNKSIDISFGIHRTFTTAPACAAWCLDLQESVPETGRAEITVRDGNGQMIVRYIEHAAITGIEAQALGVTAFVTFSIHGGAVTKTIITAPV
jgi:hypothetical protein